jgi:hypothetical protein
MEIESTIILVHDLRLGACHPDRETNILSSLALFPRQEKEGGNIFLIKSNPVKIIAPYVILLIKCFEFFNFFQFRIALMYNYSII